MPHARTTSLILALTLCSGMAIAEPDKKPSKKDLLRGPDITAPTNEHVAPTDSMNKQMNPHMEQTKKPLLIRDYFAALKHSKRGDLADKLALSKSQQEQISHITEQHRESMKVFQEKHADEIKAIRQKIKAAAKERKANKNGATGDRNNKADQPMRDELRKLIDNAPPNKHALGSLKKILSTEQFTLLTNSIHEYRAMRGKQAAQKKQGQRPRTARKNMNSDTANKSEKKKAKRTKQGVTSSDD